MTHRTRRLGLLLAAYAVAMFAAFAMTMFVVVLDTASALPPNFPKVGMVCTPGSVAGGTHTFNLVANTGDVDTPDGNSVFMWSYANQDAPDNGHFQSPGPVLCVTEGETVVVNLTNTLPEPTSIVFPGQEGVSATGGSSGLLTTEAPASGGNVSYKFTAGSPGTYLYESGSDIAKQIEMGLYGALVVRPNTTTCPPVTGTDCAYGASTRFNRAGEFLLLLAEIDPDLHHAVEIGSGTYDFNALLNHYYTINGRSFPDTVQDNGTGLQPNQPYGALVRLQPNTAANTQPSLIRMINAGALNHPFHPHGNHTTEIAQDGRVEARTEHFGETIGAGQTKDYLIRWDDVDQWNPNSNPLPVAQPNYRNLTFKDSTTWYSGTPYLGYKGTLPTGTTSENVCGEWYFPFHSHALDEFSNFDEGFGGMGTLLRVDPPGGCFTAPSATAIVGGVLKSGSVTALAADDASYYQINPKTTTRPTATTAGQTTITVASAASFPASGAYFVRIDNEVLQVTGGQGTTTWTVARGQLGTAAAGHLSGATVTALANDWYASFSGLAAGSSNLKVTYKGKNCSNTTGTACTALAGNFPQQTVKICDWTVAGATGCSSATSAGWVTLPAPPAQPQGVGSTDVSSTWTLPGPGSAYVGTGSHNGEVRVLIHTQRWTAPSPAAFSTWGNFMKLVYDSP
jgi:FtsP/CotA-like multicopper oxidase with cupredoxin domain